jgi:hypothetical protein
MRRHPHASIAAVVLAGVVSAAHGQTGPSLILLPWEDGESFEMEFDFLYQDETNTEDALDRDVQMQWYSAEARWRLNPIEEFHPTIGFELEHIEFTSSSPLVPDRLVDASLGLGTGITRTSWGGLLATFSVGFAGDSPFDDSDAWYGTANLLAAIEVSDDEGWQIGINYDRNRTLWPDVPIPTVNYYKRVSDELFIAVGMMYNVVRWTPDPDFRVIATHQSPFTLDVVAEYQLVSNLWLQAGFHNRYNAFHADGDSDRRRLFFTHRRVEGGVHWTPSPNLDLSFAVGYAFDQELERGWDSRDLDTVVELDDAPYVRLGLEFAF